MTLGSLTHITFMKKTVKNKKTRKTTEDCLYDALLFNQTKREILFPYNFE